MNPDSFTREWREFVSYHVSTAFFQEFVALLGPEVLAAYPGLERRLGRPLSELRTGVLGDAERDCDIELDCHIGINTPARRLGSVRRMHTDAPDELFAALIYFRNPDDRATGGDLEICRWKSGCARAFVGSKVDESYAALSHIVRANANTALIFVNTLDALHAVTPRSPSSVSRRLVNITGRVPRSVPEGLFRKNQKTDWRSVGRRALQSYRIRAGRF